MNLIDKENFVNNFVVDISPFPHTVIDNFIKAEYVPNILSEMNELTIDKSYYYGHESIEKNKYAFNKYFNKYLTDLFKEINNDEFINILEEKMGIKNLIRNNLELHGAGVHKVLNNGFLCMHTDFDGYRDANHGLLDRQINLLLYMNKDWQTEFRGDLCLFDRNQNKITKKIMPILNRCVIFLTPGNIHGHPSVLCLPEDNICRQSITTYYYTKNTSGCVTPVMWYHGIKDL